MNSKSTNNESPAALLPMDGDKEVELLLRVSKHHRLPGYLIHALESGADAIRRLQVALASQIDISNAERELTRRLSTAPGASESVWRCTQCGELLDETNSAWRWTGSAWQHHHEHVGHVDAQRFGASESRGSVPENDDPPLVKLAAVLQALEFEPAAVNHSAAVLSVICRAVAKQAKRAAVPTPPAVANGEPPDWAIAQAVREALPRDGFSDDCTCDWCNLYRAAIELARSAAAKGEGPQQNAT